MFRFLRTCGVLAALLVVAGPAFATDLGSAFTYQGALSQSGSPANGVYDFQVALYDAAAGGTQIGSTNTVPGVTVSAGVFTIGLAFGTTAFSDQARWLEVAVRPAGVGSYTTLTPRQLVTSAPVAQFALSGGSWRSAPSNVLYNTNDDGAVLINRSTKITGSEYFGVDAPTNSYGGMYINTNLIGEPFYGYATNGTERAWTYYDHTSDAWKVNIAGDKLVVNSSGGVGIGEDFPGNLARLQVKEGTADAIRGESTASGRYGVYGAGTAAGVFGSASNGPGVWGTAGTGIGVQGSTNSTGYGIYGSNGGSNSVGYAGYFNGRVHVAGTLSKLGGSFMIDHPLDPANKTLSHSFVESPDMMNLYNGNVTTDKDGRATITLPNWFETLNRDFRYQLTTIGSFARAMVETEIKDNQFTIRTDEPNTRVSWQVSGIRHDPYAVAHPIVVEEEKPASMKGTYLFPDGYAKAAVTGDKNAKNTSKGGR